MTRLLLTVLTTSLFVAVACERPSGRESTSPAAEPDEPSEASAGKTEETPRAKPRRQIARPPVEWIKERVAEARERLKSSEAGRILWKSIGSHGGLRTWYRNGPLHFRYDYRPKGDRPDHDTVQTVDTWSARARHHVTGKPDREYGWDGEKAWFEPKDWERPYDVRFWALTPYYFVGMPFVLADPGVELKYEGTDTIEGVDCHVLRATFGDVGISPDDFYVLYIAKDDHRLEALRYIVSYDPFFDEREHSPEKLMTYDGSQTVGGIEFAESYRFFMWSPEEKTDAKVVTEADLSQVEFRPDVKGSYFAPPEEAVIHPKDRK